MPTYEFPAPVHKDADNVPGQAFPWSHTFVDTDLTGYTAALTIDGITTNRALTVVISQVGVTTYTTLSLSLAGTITNTWLPGTYAYRVIVTAPDATTAIVTYGDLLELTPRKGTVYGTVGPEGPVGPAGATTGVSPSTLTTAVFTQPAPGVTVNVQVADSSFWSVNQALFVATAGDYLVTARPDATHITIRNLDTPGSAPAGTTIALGVLVTCNGLPGAGSELTITTYDTTPTTIPLDLSWIAINTTFRLDVSVLARGTLNDKTFTLMGLFRKDGAGTITQRTAPQAPAGVLSDDPTATGAWTAALTSTGSVQVTSAAKWSVTAAVQRAS